MDRESGTGPGPEVANSDRGSVHFRFTVLGRYDAGPRGNEPQLAMNLAAGHDDHLVYCGNLTMSEAEWEVFSAVLTRGLQDAVEIVDRAQ